MRTLSSESQSAALEMLRYFFANIIYAGKI